MQHEIMKYEYLSHLNDTTRVVYLHNDYTVVDIRKFPIIIDDRI